MSALSATARVRAALEAVAEALRVPDLGRILAAEEELSAALNALGRISSVDAQERAPLLQELIGSRAALTRCRTLGSSIDAITHASLVSQGRSAEYDRAGVRPAPVGAHGRQVKARM